MSYLEIDGLTIPVAAGSGKIAVEEIGSRSRSISGYAASSVRAAKRTIDFTTTPLTEADAVALLHILQARGLYFPFSGTSVSSSGFVPITATDLGYLTGEALGDTSGAGYVGVRDVPFGQHLGAGSICLDQIRTNFLSAETASFVSTTGSASAIDSATLARSASVSVDGSSGSLRVTTLANSNSVRGGVSLPTSAPVSPGYHVGSCYLKAYSGSPVVWVSLTNGITLSTPTEVTLSSTEWTRVSTASYLASPSTLSLQVIEKTADSAISFYVDQAQIEAGYGPSKWMAGGASRAASGVLKISSGTRTPFTRWSDGQGWSMSVWIRGGSDDTDYIYYVDAGNNLKNLAGTLTWITPSGGSLTGSYAHLTGAWTHVVCVQYETSTGTTASELWVNGALAASSTSVAGVAPYDLAAASALYIGSNGSTSVFCGAISALLYVPCRLSSRWISAIYASGAGAVFGMWPKHRVTGDILGGRAAVSMLASVKSMGSAEHYASSGWANSGLTLEVELVEV